jgi:hypothetical protein
MLKSKTAYLWVTRLGSRLVLVASRHIVDLHAVTIIVVVSKLHLCLGRALGEDEFDSQRWCGGCTWSAASFQNMNARA